MVWCLMILVTSFSLPYPIQLVLASRHLIPYHPFLSWRPSLEAITHHFRPCCFRNIHDFIDSITAFLGLSFGFLSSVFPQSFTLSPTATTHSLFHPGGCIPRHTSNEPSALTPDLVFLSNLLVPRFLYRTHCSLVALFSAGC